MIRFDKFDFTFEQNLYFERIKNTKMNDFISYLKIQLELIQTWNKCPIHRSRDIEYVHRNMLFCDECRWTKTALFQNSYEDEKRLGKLVKDLDNVRKGLIHSLLLRLKCINC